VQKIAASQLPEQPLGRVLDMNAAEVREAAGIARPKRRRPRIAGPSGCGANRMRRRPPRFDSNALRWFSATIVWRGP